MATAKQLEANRHNALLSTGPKTVEGKAAARRNALKHGLAGVGIVMPIGEEELVQERTAELCSSLRPGNIFDMFLTEEIALEQIRGERCRRLERARRQRLAEDALDLWDEPRIIAAEQLGARLRSQPALSARLLQGTLQGCDWLLERWRGLGRVLEGCGAWDNAQRRLALDLLGTPPELRRGGTPLDAGGSSVVSHQPSVIIPLPTFLCPQPTAVPDDDAPRRCVRVVIAEIERLTRLRDEVLEPRDEAEQRAAFHGEGVETDPELQLLRRYESASHRRKAWALKQLKKGDAPSSRWSPPVPQRPGETEEKGGWGPSADPGPPAPGSEDGPPPPPPPPPTLPFQIGAVTTAPAPETIADLLNGSPLSLLQALREHSEDRGGRPERRARACS